MIMVVIGSKKIIFQFFAVEIELSSKFKVCLFFQINISIEKVFLRLDCAFVVGKCVDSLLESIVSR